MQDVIHSRLPTARVAKCISAAALVVALICAAPGAYAQAGPAKALATAPVTSNTTANNIYGFKALDINGKEVDFAQFKDRVLLIVNTASQCGFTPQLTGLEQLHKKYQAQGLVVIGFPCNQFLQQDPKSNAEIDEFAQSHYGVSFLLMSKIDVNGDRAHPLYKWLQTQKAGLLGTESIKWNFTKFLINRNGQVVKRYGSAEEPAALVPDIEAAL